MDTFQQLKNYSLEVVLTIEEKKTKYLMYTIKDINPYPTAFPPGKGTVAYGSNAKVPPLPFK